jgi:hypothetical protein
MVEYAEASYVWNDAFTTKLAPDAPKLRGKANWEIWSREMKKHLNGQKVYFALNEEPPLDPKDVASGRDLILRLRQWVLGTKPYDFEFSSDHLSLLYDAEQDKKSRKICLLSTKPTRLQR